MLAICKLTCESWILLFSSVPVGIISGLYAGLIVVRYQRFSELRTKVLHIIREIEANKDGSTVILTRRTDVPELSSISSDFAFLKHHGAWTKTRQLQSEISETLYLVSKHSVDYETFENRCDNWQIRGRKLKPNLLRILRLWGGL